MKSHSRVAVRMAVLFLLLAGGMLFLFWNASVRIYAKAQIALKEALAEELEHRHKVEEIIDFLEIPHIRKVPVGRLHA